ncbi:class 1 fructose-bisphosphatase [Zavarzinia sp.]|uniref:class 1 fructose-bisphosphatase n=1 Tax=Zavarzinia sp. TaxID=2027920 RepID=UPI003566E9BA
MTALQTDRQVSLDQFLARHAAGDTPEAAAVAATVAALASAGIELAGLVARGPLAGAMGALRCDERFGDSQKELDFRAHQIVTECLRKTPVAALGSEEADEAEVLNPGAPLVVAVDPLDGSSNIETNSTIGTIFSIYPAGELSAEAALLQPGRCQFAAGLILYGPQCGLVLSLGQGTHAFTLDPETREFRLTRPDITVPVRAREYAINGSNQRHWPDAIRRYVDDCLAGTEGPRGCDFNTRWVASMVADAFRIMVRGGIYLYPGDARPGYRQGRLRLVYEANAVALLLEQAGGAATDGTDRILDLMPTSLHQRTPLVFGSADEVARVARYMTDAFSGGEDSPLFGKRSLFRA